MTFPPEGIHDVAKALKALTVPTGEGRYRTIAGRSYYAAYKATCRALCGKFGFAPDSYFPHETLSIALATHNDPDVREVGTNLNTLRLKRTHADYTLGKAFDEDAADDSVDESKALLAMVIKPAFIAKLPKVDPKTRDK